MRRAGSIALLLLLGGTLVQVHAQQIRPESANYEMITDVQPAGGGDKAKSTLYILDDTIGEGNIGESDSANYTLNAGYRNGAEGTFISLNCNTSAALGTLTRTGDTSVNTCGQTGYCATNKTSCTVVTDVSMGYTLSWIVATGTGSAGARTGTGHLNGYVAGNRIAPLGTGSTTMSTQPIAMTAGGTVNNDARWAGRLSSTSTTTGGAGLVWGTDGLTDTWLRVGTGAGVNIALRGSPTTQAGDTENIGFRAIIHGNAIVPSDVYRATVTITAVTN